MNPSRIVGAGLSGLIAAHAWPNVPIIEASPNPVPHKALLRFRTENVAHLTGIAFKKVLVRKGLWSRGAFVAPSIALANAYSAKVIGRVIGDRSIWSLDPVERFIAPEDFHERLLEHVGTRAQFDMRDTFTGDTPIISTAPMSVALKELGVEHAAVFEPSPIEVQRYRVPHCDVHQTVYFPDQSKRLYRASITGDILIIESMAASPDKFLGVDAGPFDSEIAGAFGIELDECEPLGRVTQRYGKIVSLPDAQRKHLMYRLTADHGVYSLGRFAQWRNILLDDVVNDIRVIKKLLATDSYDLRKAAS